MAPRADPAATAADTVRAAPCPRRLPVKPRQFREVPDQRCERGDARRDYPQIPLHYRPRDRVCRIDQVHECLDRVEADDLYDGDEDAEGEEADDDDFLADWDLRLDESREW